MGGPLGNVLRYGFACALTVALFACAPCHLIRADESSASVDEAARRATPHRPNIVVILADDQSYRDFGFLGNPLVHTPHIDRLAAASARYWNGYTTMSVCRPSLASVLTGQYPHRHGIHFNHRFRRACITLPE